MHWGDFRGVSPPTACTDETGATTIEQGKSLPTGPTCCGRWMDPLDATAALRWRISIGAQSGYDLSSFIFYVAGYADGTGDVPCLPPDCPFSEPHPFLSQEVLCDRLRLGRADGAGGAWARHPDARLHPGFPVRTSTPTSWTRRCAQRRRRFRRVRRGRGGDAFTKAAGPHRPGVARAIGFLPDEANSAPAILTKMCVRCHDASTDARLARSRFNATALDNLDAAIAATNPRPHRVTPHLPRRMPPLRAGDLPTGPSTASPRSSVAERWTVARLLVRAPAQDLLQDQQRELVLVRGRAPLQLGEHAQPEDLHGPTATRRDGSRKSSSYPRPPSMAPRTSRGPRSVRRKLCPRPRRAPAEGEGRGGTASVSRVHRREESEQRLDVRRRAPMDDVHV